MPTEPTYTNQLINETSPYLLQHAHNPVDWRPWGDEALKKAREENKMLIVSIGYSACHWCHVMEHESFEDTAVARLMNDHFVPIKVDREERPDVDQVYMYAAQLISGRGGWPLNALALPDGRPFFAGTYFPKEDWLRVLQYFINLYQNDRQKLIDQAGQLTEGIRSIDNVPKGTAEATYQLPQLHRIWEQWEGHIDMERGGKKGAPKFPMPTNWAYLLHYHYLTGKAEAKAAVLTTLDEMAWGGIYDHLGGGFARYSTDKHWLVPHFEKMLYDNGQLASLYAHAWQLTRKPLYKRIVYETLEYIEREMTAPEGGFYSALDADSEGEEGKYYVWRQEEIEQILGEAGSWFNDFYNVQRQGNWEHGKNILHQTQSRAAFAEKKGWALEEFEKKLATARQQLLPEREKRARPGLDDKVLTSWNALMLNGYVDAYRAFGEEAFLKAALRNAHFLKENALHDGQRLTRNYKAGQSTITGFLDDYAFLIAAFINLYQATFEEAWLQLADRLTSYVLQHFDNPEAGLFYYTPDEGEELISRQSEVSDNVIPASNSQMAINLFALGHYFYKKDYLDKARLMLSSVEQQVTQQPAFFSNWARLMAHFTGQPYEVAIVGKDCRQKRAALDGHYLPGVFFLGGEKEGQLELLQNKLIKGQTTIYVCQNKACQLPVTEVEAALEQIGGQ